MSGNYTTWRALKHKQLPQVLATEEVISILDKIQNLKHRAIIMAGYAAGLRASEIVHLKVTDLDSKRMMIPVCTFIPLAAKHAARVL